MSLCCTVEMKGQSALAFVETLVEALTPHLPPEGWSPVRPASDEDLESLPVMGTWGFRFIRALADKRLAASVRPRR